MKNCGFTNLLVWKKSMDFVEQVYGISSKFPENERFAMTNQLRRAVISIPANIAEGKGRYSSKEFIRFLYIARGSLEESKCLLILSNRLNYCVEKEFETAMEAAEEIGLMLNSFINSIKNKKDF